MLQARVAQVRRHFQDFLAREYQIELPELTVEIPPRLELGDLALTFPFELAKHLRRAPFQIAQEVVEKIGPVPHVERAEPAPPGFINLFLDRVALFRDLLSWLRSPERTPAGPKVIVEHTNINPNKAAHIGHLRNAVLGDTFVRHLRALGRRVEVQNYIDNTGVQVADVVVGFHYLRRMSLDEVAAVPEPFDYYCWDLYAEVSEWYESDPARLELRRETLEAIEHGRDPHFALAEHISNRIVRAHLQTMERIDVEYDVLPRESEILHLRFWEEAFRQLKEKGAISFAEDGPNRGCWVMRLPAAEGQPEETKIIVRSNGTVTYVGKDIAYQLWKLGLLGKTFHYRPFYTYPDGHVVWITSQEPYEGEEPEFGNGYEVYNVIDVRQSYLQRVVAEGVRSLGYPEEAQRSIHFSYEMVALSPRCCQALGIELSEEDRERPYVEVSGRKGLGVKADDLLNTLLERSRHEVEVRQPELAEQERENIARTIAVGALRYFMLKYTRNSVIAFDFDEALSFEGETGPYLQYTVVRSNNIFRKLRERDASWEETQLEAGVAELPLDPRCRDWLADEKVWQLLRDLARIEDVAAQAVQSLELSTTARHAFNVAQELNLFYHSYHILSETDPQRRLFFLVVVDAARRGLGKTLRMLGIEVPERM
ncbi:MAG: arginine--tRNA ligase [Acidobacteriota bacterium]